MSPSRRACAIRLLVPPLCTSSTIAWLGSVVVCRYTDVRPCGGGMLVVIVGRGVFRFYYIYTTLQQYSYQKQNVKMIVTAYSTNGTYRYVRVPCHRTRHLYLPFRQHARAAATAVLLCAPALRGLRHDKYIKSWFLQPPSGPSTVTAAVMHGGGWRKRDTRKKDTLSSR